MLPVGRFPILWHIMKYYASFGYNEFILCLGYKSEVIKDFFSNYNLRVSDFTLSNSQGKVNVVYHNKPEEGDWKITFVETGLNTMTGARVRKIRDYIGSDPYFMLTYGDGLGDVDISKLVEFHRSNNVIATVTGVQPPSRFGELTLGDGNLVLGFNEKPQSASGYINGGFFIFKNEVFKYLDGDDNLVLERGPMEDLVQDKQLMVYKHDGFWQPMDTSREFQFLNDIYEKGDAPWVRW
jgi:glucose-1-phosphate cytidylyltransferase